MDFNDTAEESLFRAEARDFLNAHAQLKNDSEPRDESETDYLARAKAWQKLKYENGWACLNWPKEYGGRDATPMQLIIWNQEESRYDVPTAPFAIGLGMCGPTMIAYASEQQKARHAAAHGFRREHLVPAVQRTGRRFRSRGVAHESRTRRRRVDHQRPEDLDVRRALQRLGHSRDTLGSDRAEAQGPHVLFPRTCIRPA